MKLDFTSAEKSVVHLIFEEGPGSHLFRARILYRFPMENLNKPLEIVVNVLILKDTMELDLHSAGIRLSPEERIMMRSQILEIAAQTIKKTFKVDMKVDMKYEMSSDISVEVAQ